VVEDIDREGRPAARVGIKVRYRPFITVSRSLTLPDGVDADRIEASSWRAAACRISDPMMMLADWAEYRASSPVMVSMTASRRTGPSVVVPITG